MVYCPKPKSGIDENKMAASHRPNKAILHEVRIKSYDVWSERLDFGSPGSGRIKVADVEVAVADAYVAFHGHSACDHRCQNADHDHGPAMIVAHVLLQDPIRAVNISCVTCVNDDDLSLGVSRYWADGWPHTFYLNRSYTAMTPPLC